MYEATPVKLLVIVVQRALTLPETPERMAIAASARNARSNRIVLMFRLERWPIRSESDHTARPTAMRSVFRQEKPITARAKAIRATTRRMVFTFMGAIFGYGTVI